MLDGDKSFYGVGNGGNMGLRHKEVVLTFDDGPSPYTTNKILRTLRQHCTKATFFVVGAMARAYPSTLRNVARAGHTIAHHSYSHGNLTRKHISASARDVEKGFNAVRRALGPEVKRNTHLFRYPYLARNSRLDSVVKTQGLLPVSASIMSQDWKQGSSDSVVNRVMRQLDRQKRGVILMHDIQRRTAQALPKLLRRLDREGYKIVHIKGRRAPEHLYDAAPMIAKLNSGKAPKRTAVARAKPERKTLVARLREKHHEIKKRHGKRSFIAKAPEPSFDIAALMPAENVVTALDANVTDTIVTGNTTLVPTEPAVETRSAETQTVAVAALDRTSPRLAEAVTKASAPPSQAAKVRAVEPPTVQPSVAAPAPAPAPASDSVRVAIATPAREPAALASASRVPAKSPAPSITPSVSIPLDATPDETSIAMVTPLVPSAPSRTVVANTVHKGSELERTTTVLASTKPVDLNKAPATPVVVETVQDSEKPEASKTDVALASEPPAPKEAVAKPVQATSSPLRRWFQRRRQQAQQSSNEPTVPTHSASLERPQTTKPTPSVSNTVVAPKPSKAENIAGTNDKAKPSKSPLRRWFQRRREARERAREEALAEEQAAEAAQPERVSSL
ncbi:MAG: polysaccharide deacetylase family protein [Pseudomonadota bacterium]